MDIDELLTPVSEESPAGEDLEYDADFGELERTSQGTPEKVMGDDNVIEAVPPDWRAVRDQALGLFDRTRDLRVAVHLTNALLRQDGFAGLRDGLSIIYQMSENMWDTVHPQLDEDDGDPMMRCNAVRELANREMLLQGVLDAPFVSSRVAGSFGLRDLKIISGELKQKSDDERPPPQRELINAAFQDADAEALDTTVKCVTECIEATTNIQNLYTEKVGAMDAPDLAELISDLEENRKFLAMQMSRLGLSQPEEGESGESAPGASEGGGGVAGAGTPVSGDVRSRDDVLRMIDKICLYYTQQEPSSPVPILLRRAGSLVNKSFMDIVADLAPSGVSEAQRFEADETDSAGGWSAPGTDSGGGGVESGGDSW